MIDYSPYRALWSAVIIQAFRDLKYRSAHGDGTKEDPALVMGRAYVWINEHDPKYTNQIGSFEWICSMLDLGARELRKMSRSREGVNRVLSGKFHFGEV